MVLSVCQNIDIHARSRATFTHLYQRHLRGLWGDNNRPLDVSGLFSSSAQYLLDTTTSYGIHCNKGRIFWILCNTIRVFSTRSPILRAKCWHSCVVPGNLSRLYPDATCEVYEVITTGYFGWILVYSILQPSTWQTQQTLWEASVGFNSRRLFCWYFLFVIILNIIIVSICHETDDRMVFFREREIQHFD